VRDLELFAETLAEAELDQAVSVLLKDKEVVTWGQIDSSRRRWVCS